jgi:ubiquitin carboxyl-terminal hydrolase L5
MLRELGVQGVKIHEVYGLDEEMLAILPQPVHALIFLFHYRDIDETMAEKGKDCPSHVWFANQLPDFACASVALVNIVNNIKGLRMGKELRDFKEFTKDMAPLDRGDAIDNFTFVRQIHNSFARENDLLTADVHCRNKSNKMKKRLAAAKARETREAKKETNGSVKASSSKRTTPKAATPQGMSTQETVCRRTSHVSNSTSSPLSDPPDLDPEFTTTPSKLKPSTKRENGVQANDSRRRSSRQPKPRQDPYATNTATTKDDDEEEGFHFIAYMPIDGHVWRMDGLDSFPQDIGEFDSIGGGDWMNLAAPALQERMALYEGADIEFNLMAVVHDPLMKEREALIENIRCIRAADKKLDSVVEDWRILEGAETPKDLILGTNAAFDISNADVEADELPLGFKEELERDDDLIKLIELRKRVLCEQGPLRGGVRDALESSKSDAERARHRRHDYGMFVRTWLGALADQEVLSQLVDGNRD